MPDEIITHLLSQPDPAIHYLVHLHLLGENPASASMQQLQQAVPASPQVQALLAKRKASGELPFGPYTKWVGAHWVLVSLAELGYPTSDESLLLLRAQMAAWLSREKYTRYYASRVVNGKTRMHPSIEGNFIWYSLKFGWHDDFIDQLVETIISWQWPDGGWNCDMHPHVQVSSFTESLIPLRALSLYAQQTSHPQAARVARQAAEVFLSRRLFRRLRDGQLIKPDFLNLHYPCYWHYDILFALKVILEAGFLDDPRCNQALDLLESKRLPGGGFPAEKKFYAVSEKQKGGSSQVDWGGTSKSRLNHWVSIEALRVLRAAGRL